jgi:hypothetical protein
MKSQMFRLGTLANSIHKSFFLSRQSGKRRNVLQYFGTAFFSLYQPMAIGIILQAVGLLCRNTSAQDFNTIEYLCCDWGPAMILPATTNGAAQFSYADDEVYFLKQVRSFATKKRMTKDTFGSRDNEDVGKGLSIYLCKMKSDGSAKMEIKELWRNPAYSIDTQDQNTWMDVNRKTRKIAFSISYGGGDITGLWSISLDGSELKQLIKPATINEHRQPLNSPSWTPNGEWIFFDETLHKHPDRISILKYNIAGATITRVLEGTEKVQYKEPRVSPDGKRLAFSRYPNGYPGGRFIWTSTLDGEGATPIGGGDSLRNWGSYPAWSPDGKQLLFTGSSCRPVVDVTTGLTMRDCDLDLPRNSTWGWPHWGRQGVIGFAIRGIIFTDIEGNVNKIIGKPIRRDGLANRW